MQCSSRPVSHDRSVGAARTGPLQQPVCAHAPAAARRPVWPRAPLATCAAPVVGAAHPLHTQTSGWHTGRVHSRVIDQYSTTITLTAAASWTGAWPATFRGTTISTSLRMHRSTRVGAREGTEGKAGALEEGHGRGRRAGTVACASAFVAPPLADECASDADCTAGAKTRCAASAGTGRKVCTGARAPCSPSRTRPHAPPPRCVRPPRACHATCDLRALATGDRARVWGRARACVSLAPLLPVPCPPVPLSCCPPLFLAPLHHAPLSPCLAACPPCRPAPCTPTSLPAPLPPCPPHLCMPPSLALGSMRTAPRRAACAVTAAPTGARHDSLLFLSPTTANIT